MSSTGRPWLLLAGLAWAPGGPHEAAAQGLGPLVRACGAQGSAAAAAPCRSGLLAARAVRGGTALAGAMGTELAGASSTLGRRPGGALRLSLGARIDAVRFRMPDILSGGADRPGRTTVLAWGPKGTAALGVLDGFSVSPSVGGLLSFDVLGSLGLLFLEEEDGFSGDMGIVAVGGRLGLVRESFTMPGLTASLTRVYGQTVVWGGLGAHGAEVEAGVSTTSFRATLGKDAFGIALLVGAGADWQAGDFTLRALDSGAEAHIEQGAGGLVTRRGVFYGGASLTHLVYQLTLEAGWATGFDELPGHAGDYDPTSPTPFANLAARLTI